MSRNERMLNEPIRTLIPSLAIPTILSMLITAIYNMADTFFVGRISTAASGAIGVVYPLTAMIQAVAFTIGMGSGANLSRALGAGDTERAETLVSVGFFTAFAGGVVIMLACMPLISPLMLLLGATPTIEPLAEDYARYILLAAPFMMSSFAMNNMLRFQGMTSKAAVGITTGGLLNIVLDPLLIFGLNMGVAGAAIATAASQFVSFCILLRMCNKGKETIPVRFSHFRPSAALYGSIFYNGVPSLGRQGIASISTIVLNNAAAVYGDPAIAAMSIVTRFVMFVNSAIIGFGQGFQPVCGFCFGAGKYSRVREAFMFSVKVAAGMLLILCVPAMLCSGQIIQVFRDDPQVIEIGTFALRLQLATVPLWSVIILVNMATQSMGYGASSLIASCSRQGIFLIPALLILPPVFGLVGIQCAQPAADIFSFILCLWMAIHYMNKLKGMPDRL